MEAAKILDIPVIATEQNPKALGCTVKELGPIASPIPKSKFSMFTDEVLTALKSHDAANVVLFGIETCLDFLRENYGVYVLADGVSSMNQGEVKVALERMRQCGAYVTTSESILFEILGDAAHPEFKAISSLVKATKASTSAALDALVLQK